MYAVITGASGGIGQELAMLLAVQGYDLVLCGRNLQQLCVVKKRCVRYGVKVHVLHTDLSRTENCIQLYRRLLGLDVGILINCAGIGLLGEFTQIPVEADAALIHVNIMAPMILTKLFSGSMKRGFILNICSSAAFSPDPLMASYGASKAFLLYYSRAVNCELKKSKKKITVSAGCCGPVNTDFNAKMGILSSGRALSASQCAKILLEGMFRRREIILVTVQDYLAYGASKILPTAFQENFLYLFQKNKLNHSLKGVSRSASQAFPRK